MILLPAIDLKDGKVVRLYKGDFNTVHQVSEDPLTTAAAFAAAGARYVHMVDLDGAYHVCVAVVPVSFPDRLP
ncbi:MAG: hypothetical protein HFF32_04300 [Flavonifractor sp.]|nr:hypothetical protein [Flavonifractor sp.]